ncbi:MAG: AMP-binding protein [Acidimicrobiales bacterium]
MTLLDHAAADPHARAVNDLERTRSRGELVDRGVRLGRWMLGDGGLAPAGHVSMLLGNRVEMVDLLVAAQLSGTWITAVNYHLTAPEVAYILEDSGSTILFTDPQNEAVARAAAALTPTEVSVVVAGPELDALAASGSDEPFPLDGPGGGTMLYTSGTTGRPKGVKRARQGSLGATLTVGAAAGMLLGLDGKGPHLVTGPLYHAAPLGFAAIDLANGAELVLMPRWDESHCLDLIEEHAVRNSHIVPTMCVRLLRLPEEQRVAFDPSSLSTVLHGAAPIAPQVKHRMIEWWGPVLTEYWGSTEGGVFTLVDSAAWLTKPGTVGKAIPSYDVFAVDADGTRLPAGEVGTLFTRNLVTDAVFEYHQAPEKTDAAHMAPGTFTMGDVGHVDDHGFVFLSDRAANMIISGGVNIYPAEIEQELIDHPAVADVAVFGVPDDEWGEQVKAAVELADGYVASPELEAELLLFARQRLAGFKVPRSVDFEAELPRHPTGKLFTRLLRDKYWQGVERAL